MSNTQYAFMLEVNVPSKTQWQESIDQLAFPVRLELDPQLQPFENEGFSPCRWGESDADVGFEIFYEPAAEIHADDEALKAIAGDNDCCISMRWGGDMKDCAAVMMASCALAKDFGAVISYQGEAPDPLDVLIMITHELILVADKGP